MLPSNASLGYLRSLSSSVLLTRTLHVFLLVTICATCPARLIFLGIVKLIIFIEDHISENLIMQLASEFSLFVLPYKYLHLPQSYILEYRQPLRFLQYDKPN
jgi:hypothetical protein